MIVVLKSFYCYEVGGTPDFDFFIKTNFRNLKLAIVSQGDILQ